MNWKLIRKSKEQFVVENDGNIAAHMDISFDEETVFLDYAFVDPTYRGTGAGNFLVKEVISQLKPEAKKIVPVCGYVQAVVRKNKLLE